MRIFCVNQKIFKYLRSNIDLIFEKEPLEALVKKKQLIAYKHNSSGTQ